MKDIMKQMQKQSCDRILLFIGRKEILNKLKTG